MMDWKERRNIYLIVFALWAFLSIVLWPYRHFSGDDAYITFQFAKNLSMGNGFSFNPGEPTYGSTSPIWVFILAGMHRLGLEIPVAAHLLNYLFSSLAVILFFFLTRLFLKTLLFSCLATCFFILDPWFVRWAMSGLENALVLFLIVASFYTHLRFRNSNRLNFLTPVIIGLGLLTRPEFVLLALVVLSDILLYEKKKKLLNISFGVVIIFLLITPWTLYAYNEFWTLIPNTIEAKKTSQHWQAFIKEIYYLVSFWTFQACALFFVFIVFSKARSKILDPIFWSKWFLLIAWTVGLFLFYLIGGAPVAGRYLVYSLPALLLIGARSLELLITAKKLVVLCVIANFCLLIWMQYYYCWYITKWPQGMDPRMIKLADWVREYTKKGDIIATDQIGVMGYFSDRYIFDLAGLVTPSIWPYLSESHVKELPAFLASQKIQYMVSNKEPKEMKIASSFYAHFDVLYHQEVVREGAQASKKPITYYIYKTNW